jgi:hypothetical protein
MIELVAVGWLILSAIVAAVVGAMIRAGARREHDAPDESVDEEPLDRLAMTLRGARW